LFLLLLLLLLRQMWPDGFAEYWFNERERKDELADVWSAATRTYLMRPNREMKEVLQQVLDVAMPASFNPERAISLPIRGTLPDMID
jgi:hypothetical protein